MGEETNAKGYYLPVVVKEDECKGCDLCEAICPDFAISVIHFDRREDKDNSIPV